MGHQSYVLLCTETALSNHPAVIPKSSCDVHLLRSPWLDQVNQLPQAPIFASLKLQNLWNWDRRRQRHKQKEKNGILACPRNNAHTIGFAAIISPIPRLWCYVNWSPEVPIFVNLSIYLSRGPLKLQNLWNCDTKGVGISQKRKEKIVACPRHNAHTSGFAAIISPLLRPWGWGYFFSLRSAFASRLAVRPKTVRLPLLPRH